MLIAGRYELDREIGPRRHGLRSGWATDAVLGREVALKRIGMMPGADRPRSPAGGAGGAPGPHGSTIPTWWRSFDLVTEGEETWLVMEYVEGVSLSGLISRDGAPHPPTRPQPLVRQAGRCPRGRPCGRHRPPAT